MITQDNRLLSGYGRDTGSTIGPGGASVASSTTVTKVGNRTTTETTEIVGDKRIKKVTQETEVGGEVTEYIADEKKAGYDKYGGLTKEEYYEGKGGLEFDQATGLEFVTVSPGDASFRQGKLVEDECLAAGGGTSECYRKKREYQVEKGFYTKSKSSVGRDVYTPTFEVGERTKVAR